MASHKSALKAHRQSLKQRERNRQLRSQLRGALRSVRSAIDSGETGKAREALREIVSLIDRMAGKGVIHDNAAGRYKSRLTRQLAARTTAAERRS